ncbi:hypothetical protein LWI28_009544 [Acer negundo]|uniref:Uncharacterized protein n=1 Tax=Acer negundo TaxID=4023 RepID=A0AAD5IGP2_ACENE|nr:hypothetical protein LWI28_009544 [Acer negundo]
MLIWTDEDPILKALDGHQSHRGVASTYRDYVKSFEAHIDVVRLYHRRCASTIRDSMKPRGMVQEKEMTTIFHRGGGSQFMVKMDNVVTSDFLT